MVDNQFKEGVRAALPIVVGYLPVGMAFGVLARKAGLSPVEAGSMSFLVYAGASQFVQGGGDHGFRDFDAQIPAVLRFAGVESNVG